MFLVLKISWYNHRVFTEYEGIERKLLLETSEANINNLVDAVPAARAGAHGGVSAP